MNYIQQAMFHYEIPVVQRNDFLSTADLDSEYTKR